MLYSRSIFIVHSFRVIILFCLSEHCMSIMFLLLEVEEEKNIFVGIRSFFFCLVYLHPALVDYMQ